MSANRDSSYDAFLDRLEHWLDSVVVRIVLSLLILFSVLPEVAFGPLGRWFFLSVFGTELIARSLLFERRLRQRQLRGGSLVVLLLDLVAVVSFLPLPLDAGSLRLLRLGRLLVLLVYWRGLGRELWVLMSRPERRFQVLVVLFLGFLLALTSAVLLFELGAPHDYNADGKVDQDDEGFLDVLWWGVRQVQDPGNLVPEVHSGVLLLVSVTLTFSGLLLFSFLIGIGTTVVGELVELSQSRQVGLRKHTVVLGLTPYTGILLGGLARMYRKNLRTFSGAVLAPASDGDAFDVQSVRGFRYRQGLPSQTRDLDRVDVPSSKRVIILGDDSTDPDAGVISAILATRERNPTVDLYPDLEHERNFPAARAAGGEGTHLVGSGPFLGYYLAQNIAYPGIFRLYRVLLRSTGIEIYTYVFSAEERRALRRRRRHWSPLDLHRRVAAGGVELLGLFTAADPGAEMAVEDLDLLINPVRRAATGRPHSALDDDGGLRPESIRGLIGVAANFSSLTRLARQLIHDDSALELTGDAVEPRAGSDELVEPALRWVPDRHQVERVLILGAGPRAPRLIRELVGFFGFLRITVLARDGEPWAQMAHDARVMLVDEFGCDPSFEEGDESIRLELRCASDEGRDIDLALTFVLADWTHRHQLERAGAVTLEEADVIVLLLGGDREQDRDGSIALDALHLANLERSGSVRFKPGVHIVALVRDPDKGRLLAQRLEGGRGDGPTGKQESNDGEPRYTVIARETARHRFIMQSVFVHGLNSIYLELLSSQGQFLSRLVPRTASGQPPAGDFDPSQLWERFLLEQGLILIGFEAQNPKTGRPRIEVGPKYIRGSRRAWSDVTALFVLGDGADLARAGS